MKISKRGEYALRALIDMGIAQEMGRPLVQIGELADKENLPIKFLEQILMQLKEGGFVESKRGKRGGYFLLLPAKKVKFGQVIRLVDGPLAPISCVSVIAYERCSCPNEELCGLHMLMEDVRTAISNILDRFTLADAVEMTLKKVKRTKASIPFIDSLLTREVQEDMYLPKRFSGAKASTAKASPAKTSAEKGVPKGSPVRKPSAARGTGTKPVRAALAPTSKPAGKRVKSVPAAAPGGKAGKEISSKTAGKARRKTGVEPLKSGSAVS